MVPLRSSSSFRVHSSGMILAITIVILLSFPYSSTCEDKVVLPNTTQTNFPINNVDVDVDVEGEGEKVVRDSTSTSTPILFDNCDIDTYYEGRSKDRGDWGWNREEIASLLLRTHRRVIPSEAAIEFLSGGAADLVASATLSRTYATNTNTRKALIELDKGEENYSSSSNSSSNNTAENNYSDIETVRMIFTQRDIPVDNGLVFGWEPGFLWPVDEFVHSSSSSSTNEVEKNYQKDYQDELSAAVHDLHNIRPRVPIVNKDHQAKNWYYDSCDDCDFQGKNGMAQQRTDGRASNNSPKWDGVNINGNDFILDDDDDEGSDHLCVCTKKHALQPPEEARGEVARALLYMNLRYGTRTAAHNKRRNLNVDFLDLTLTDCPPVKEVGDDDGDSHRTANNMGYFSRLVQWHRENPPSQHEIDRNQKICEQYQGNRNPFVDFYEESWTLLDFDRIEREVCNGKGYSNHQGESNDDTYYDDDFVATQQHTISDEHLTKDSQEDTKNGYACGDLIPGDVSFFMVQPGTIDSSDKRNYLNQDEELQRESFGLVALVDLEPGLTLYVVGVDDDDIGSDSDIDIINATATEGHYGSDGGRLKVEVPKKGIPNGSYFGFGKGLYLGDQWEPVLEEGVSHRFSVQQLYLYCIDRDDEDEIGDSSMMDEYKILAAMSTTGYSFGENELPSYWENFQNQHSSIILSETFTNGIYYGLIVLPEDASDSELSGGYRYMGPTYTKHDKYAKALIDEANWKRVNSLGGENGVYGEVAEQTVEQSTTRGIVDPSKWPWGDNNGMEQKPDESIIDITENSSSGYCQRSTLQTPGLPSFCSVVTCIIIPSILILVN